MAFVVDRDTKAGVFVEDSSKVIEHMMNPNNMVWLDFYQPNYRWIQQKFRIPKRLINACLEDGSYCEFIKGMFLLKIVAMNADDIDETVFLKIIVGERVIFTLRDSTIRSIDPERLDGDKLAVKLAGGADNLLCYFLDRITKDYRLVLEKLQNECDAFQLEHIGNFNPYDKIYDLSNRVTSYPQIFTQQLVVLRDLACRTTPLLKKSSILQLRGVLQRVRSVCSGMVSLEKSLMVFLKIQSIHSLSHSYKNLRMTIIVSALALMLCLLMATLFF